MELHQQISNYYSRKQSFTGGQAFRQWIGSKSFDEQYEIGGGGGESQVAGPGGQCICRSVSQTLYIHTHDGRLIREYSDNEGTLTKDYMWAGDKRVGMFDPAHRLYYFVTDHLGSTRQLLDAGGMVKDKYDYYAYGNTRRAVTSVNTKVRYTGKYHDDEMGVNQTYYGARYLSNGLSRFTSVDPLQAKYPGWSPYVYGACNPVRIKDPDGASWTDAVKGFGDALNSNFNPNYARTDFQNYPDQDKSRSHFMWGQVAGDLASIVGGLYEAGAGGNSLGLSIAGVPASGGASLALAPVGGAMVVHGGGASISGGMNLGNTLARMVEGPDGKMGQNHHIATNKSMKSGYTEKFRSIFEKAGMKLEDAPNTLHLEGHSGRHSNKYHEHVLKRLEAATNGRAGSDYTTALHSELSKISDDLLANPDMIHGAGL